MHTSITLSRSVSGLVKANNLIIIRKNDTTMVKWICNVRLEKYYEIMFAESKDAMIGHLERMEENTWPGTSREFVVGDNLTKEWSRKTWSELIKIDH